MAFVADTYIYWHSEDKRTKEDRDNGVTVPIVQRVELAPGDAIPKCIPQEVQAEWARTVYKIDAYGNDQTMAHYDERVEAPEQPAGPPRMMLPIGPIKSGDFERMYSVLPQQPSPAQKSEMTGQHPNPSSTSQSHGKVTAPAPPVVRENKGQTKGNETVVGSRG